MKCPECGNEISSDSAYCSCCGHVFAAGGSSEMAGNEGVGEKKGFSDSIGAIRENSRQRKSAVRIIVVLAVAAIAVMLFLNSIKSADSSSVSVSEQPQPAESAPVVENGNESFWGVWIGAFKSEENAYSRAAEAQAAGFDASVYLSNEWSNLNQDQFFVVSAGRFEDEASAQAVLSSVVDAGFSDAYVRHTGDRKS